MKVWWVLIGADYYPSMDNFSESFETEDEAIAYVEEFKNSDRSNNSWTEIINISDRL